MASLSNSTSTGPVGVPRFRLPTRRRPPKPPYTEGNEAIHELSKHWHPIRRADRVDHAEPSAAAQCAVAGVDAGADRLPGRRRARSRRSRGNPGRRGEGLLFRTRSLRDGGPRYQRIPAAVRRVQRADDEDPVHSATGDRGGARHRHRGGVPVGGHLRPGHRVGPGGFRHARRAYRLVLHDPHGGLEPRGGGQARPPNAADGRDGERGHPGGRGGRRLPGRPTLTVSLGKQAYYTQIDLDQPKAYAYAKEVMSMNSLAADAQEGISAFLEKRAPCWTGR